MLLILDNQRGRVRSLALDRFEQYDGKLSRTVLRGLGGSNLAWLPCNLPLLGQLGGFFHVQLPRSVIRALRSVIERQLT